MAIISKNARLSALFTLIALTGVSAKGVFITKSQILENNDAEPKTYLLYNITGEQRWLPTSRMNGSITVESRENEKENVVQEIRRLQKICDSEELQAMCDSKDLQKICDTICDAQTTQKHLCISGCLDLKSQRENVCNDVLPALKVYYELLNDPNFTVKEQKFPENEEGNQ